MNRYPQMLAGRQVLTGVWHETRYGRSRRGRNGTTLGHMIADMISPLPVLSIWTLLVPNGVDDAVRVDWYVQLKSKRVPKALAGVESGERVTVRASILPFGNGFGGYMSGVVLLSRTRDAVPGAGTAGLVASGDDVVTGAEGGVDGRSGGAAERVAGGGDVPGCS